MFFFSSRRRHTRWPRDWSSACALPIFYRSDMSVNLVGTPRFNQIHTHVTTVKNFSHHLTPIQIAAKNDTKERSEERRVGKEGRTRMATYKIVCTCKSKIVCSKGEKRHI